MSKLLIAAQVRGRDSTGLAWRDADKKALTFHKSVDNARAFVNDSEAVLSQARRSKTGLAHTRRASLNIPINIDCAHPFVSGKLMYAHNGFIRNWKELDNTAQSDSMVIGSRLNKLDLSDVIGRYSLVWLERDQAYCLKVNQDLVGIICGWELGADSGTFAMAISTEGIFLSAANDVRGLKFEYELLPLVESERYRLHHDNLEAMGQVPFNPESLKKPDDKPALESMTESLIQPPLRGLVEEA